MIKINLLMVSNYFGTHRGGIEITAERLCGELSTHFPVGVCLSAFTPPAPDNTEDSAVRVPLDGWNGIEKFTGVPFPIPNIKSMRTLWYQVKWADVVMIFETIYLANFVAFLMARRAKKPVMIVQFVSTIPYRSRLLRGLMSFANRCLVSSAMSRVEQVVFTSTNTQEYFQDKIRFRNPYKLIFGGVDTLVFFPIDMESKIQLRLSLGIRLNGKVCLFVGRFVEKKGIHILQRLAEIMPDVQWIVAGWGHVDPDDWRLSNVRVERKRSGATLASLYQCADVLVLPSVGEGLPLVIQEALACGLPVLCSTNTIEADPKAKAFYYAESVDSGDIQGTAALWEKKLRQLFDVLPEDFDRNGAIDYVMKHWSWQQSAYQYHELLVSLAQGSMPNSRRSA